MEGFKPATTILLLMVCFLLVPATAYSQPETPDAFVGSDYLNLRAAPTTQSDVLTILSPGMPLTILETALDDTWLHVETPDGDIGWVYALYIVVNIDLTTAFPAVGSGDSEIRLPADVVTHIQRVYAAGQRRGNRADVFAKVGDSITVSILWLNPIGDGLYNLADHIELQDVIDFYSAGETRGGHNSFNETPIAAGIGWTTYSVLDPDLGDPSVCRADESPLVCAYRVLQPSVAVIMYGTNDVGVLTAGDYRANLGEIVELTEARGIIPVLSTIPPRYGYEDRVLQFNRIIVDVAAQYSIPLLDYGTPMAALGQAGLDMDQVHPSVPPMGYEGAADFSRDNLDYGYVVRNLTALQMLDAVWHSTQD